MKIKFLIPLLAIAGFVLVGCNDDSANVANPGENHGSIHTWMKSPYSGVLARVSIEIEKLGYSQIDRLQILDNLYESVSSGGHSTQLQHEIYSDLAVCMKLENYDGQTFVRLLAYANGFRDGLVKGFQKLRDNGTIGITIDHSNIIQFAEVGVLNSELVIRALLGR